LFAEAIDDEITRYLAIIINVLSSSLARQTVRYGNKWEYYKINTPPPCLLPEDCRQ